MYGSTSAESSVAKLNEQTPQHDIALLSHRFNDPKIGRFISFDAFEASADAPESLHKYNYADADPVNKVDPTGNFAIAIPMLGFVADFLRFALDPGRNWQGKWYRRDFVRAFGWEDVDPFEMADLHVLAAEAQLGDLMTNVRQGIAHVAESTELTWGMIWSAWDNLPFNDPESLILGAIGGRACFVAGTQVIVGINDDGTYLTKPIEDLREGDLVLARDQSDQDDDADLQAVIALFRKISDHVRMVSIRDGDGDEEVIHTTDEHPFWVTGRGWVAAKDLKPGESVSEGDGSNDAVVAFNTWQARPDGITVFNLEVSADHTYFVADASGNTDVAVWVHNACVTVRERASMSLAAQRYQAGAAGYKKGFAPALTYQNPFGGRNVVKLDGQKGRTLIDRKLAFFSSSKGKLQLQRMSEAQRQNPSYKIRIEVPHVQALNRGITLLRQLGIQNINLKLVPF